MMIDFHTHQPVPAGIKTPLSFGIHPWNADREALPCADDQRWISADLIGECGLDRCKGPTMDLQLNCFEYQIAIAERLKKPMVIHCVRATDLLMKLRKHYTATPWVVHGFAGDIRQARQLMDKGIALSIGIALTNPNKTKLRETIKSLGIGQFFLETDNSGADIHHLYHLAAAIMGISIATLEEAIKQRYNTLFYSSN